MKTAHIKSIKIPCTSGLAVNLCSWDWPIRTAILPVLCLCRIEGENSFENLKDKETLVAFFAKHFPDTKEVIPDLVEDFFKNPTSYLVTIKCYPWTYENKVALIGDAAHRHRAFLRSRDECRF